MNDLLQSMLENGALLVILAILTESLTEILKNMIPNRTIQDRFTYLLSIFVGISLAFAFNLNFFDLNGYGKYISIISAGLLASRGANYANGFLKNLIFYVKKDGVKVWDILLIFQNGMIILIGLWRRKI